VPSPQDVPNFEDRWIKCVDCEEDFVFESGEQVYFWSKRMSDPKRCPACRKLRKDRLAVVTQVLDRRENSGR
jgi:hypothetical protein